MIIDFIASTAFFIIPVLLGYLFIRSVFFAWVLGALLWLMIYSLFSILAITPTLLRVTVIFISIVSLFGTLFILVKPTISIFKKTNTYSLLFLLKHQSRKMLPLVLLLTLLSAMYFLIWKDSTPYPMQVNWDIYEHIALANKISQGHFSLIPSKISDTFTFDGYTTIFHTLLSLPRVIFQTDLIGVYWWLEYWYFLFTIIAVFTLTKKLITQTEIALAAAFLSGLVFESRVVYSPFFLLPQTLAALITIFLLANLPKSSFKLLLLTIVLTLTMHFIIGALAILLIILIYYLNSPKVTPKLLNRLIFISTFLFIFSLGLNLVGQLTLTSREEAAYFNLSLPTKLNLLADWYSLTLPIFAALTYYFSIKTYFKGPKLTLIIALITTAISLLPVSYFLKFFVLSRYFVIIVITLGIYSVVNNLNFIKRIMALAMTSLVFLLVFYFNQQTYKDPLYFEGRYSHFSLSELKAALWLQDNFDQNTLLISDPSTQYIFEAISGLNTPGGAYMNLTNRQTLSQIANFSDINQIKYNLSLIDDRLPQERQGIKRVLLVIGGRYLAWQKLPEEWKASYYYNIWRPHKIEITDLSYLNFLTSDPNFKLLYQNDELAILEI